MRFYLIGGNGEDGNTNRLMACSIHHTLMNVVDSADEEFLNMVANFTVQDAVEYIDSILETRAYKLMMGKLRSGANDEDKERWAEKAWIPATDKLVQWQEYDDNEVIKAFEDMYDRRKKNKVKMNQLDKEEEEFQEVARRARQILREAGLL